jgi:hypothetical protein
MRIEDGAMGMKAELGLVVEDVEMMGPTSRLVERVVMV